MELGCAGTIIKHIKQGLKVGIIDLLKENLGQEEQSLTRFDETKNDKSSWCPYKRKHGF